MQPINNLHAIVPVKALDQAKSRLACALTPPERRQLTLEMLERVLAALNAAPLAAVWVVSPDAEVLERAAALGARPLLESRAELNPALEQARSAARAAGAAALIVVPADVPLVSPEDIDAMAGLLARGADMVLASDALGMGTNALALRAGAEVPFRFGGNSAAIHLRAAVERGLVARLYRSPRLALDVDDSAGLARYRAELAALPLGSG